MYLWKCWRDSRSHFIASLIALPALCVLFTYMAFRLGDPDAMRKGTTPSVIRAWSTTTEIVLGGWASVFTLMWGLILGAAGLGEEFKERSADFLLVRPRRRSYWVWTGWSVGVSELIVMAFLTVVATFGTLTYLTGHVQSWWPLTTTLPLAVGGAVAYGLTYFTTLVVRSGRQGLSYGVGILFIDMLLPAAMSYYWNVNFPSVLGFMMAACKWLTDASGAFPAGSLVLWTAIALAFPFAAQLLLERAEV
jgi:ABC-type transport system involved in multi-copper enzyme maturation permease subunit